jgi:hypothetical protein
MHVPILGLFVVTFLGVAVALWCFLCFRMGLWLAGGCDSMRRRRHFAACAARRDQWAGAAPTVPPSPRVDRPRQDKPSAGIGMLLVLLLLFLAFFGFRTRSEWKHHIRPGFVQIEDHPDQKPATKNPTFTVTKFGKTAEDAEQLAMEEAYHDLRAYVERELPNPKWTPSMDYFRRHLVKSKQQEEAILPDDQGKVKVIAQQVSVKVELNAETHKDLLRRGRMLMLLQVLGSAIVLLVAVAGYIRIDELTKGYYVGWLRLAAIAALGAAVFMMLA